MEAICFDYREQINKRNFLIIEINKKNKEAIAFTRRSLLLFCTAFNIIFYFSVFYFYRTIKSRSLKKIYNHFFRTYILLNLYRETVFDV